MDFTSKADFDNESFIVDIKLWENIDPILFQHVTKLSNNETKFNDHSTIWFLKDLYIYEIDNQLNKINRNADYDPLHFKTKEDLIKNYEYLKYALNVCFEYRKGQRA